MRRNATGLLIVFLAASLLTNAGCRSGGIPLLNLLGVGKPLVVALVAEQRPLSASKPLELLNPFAPYEPLRQALGKHIGRDVALDLCLPLQVKPNLTQGFYDVAILSPSQYGQLAEPESLTVVAVSTDDQQRTARSALLIVPQTAKIQAIADLPGKKVAFGPAGDARTHQAGLELLHRNGLATTDLSLEVFPLPGSLRHFPDMRSIAQSVLSGSYDAGFIDELAWEKFSEREEREGEPARDQLRVIAKTLAVPDRLVICSPKLSAGDRDKVGNFLFAAAQDHPEVLRPLRIAGYQQPSAELLSNCRSLFQPPRSEETGAE